MAACARENKYAKQNIHSALLSHFSRIFRDIILQSEEILDIAKDTSECYNTDRLRLIAAVAKKFLSYGIRYK